LYAFNRDSHSRSGNYVAWDYSYNILMSCEPNAVLFTNGDNDTFPLWYLQEVEGIRKDVRVVCLSLLNTPWYIKQLRDVEPRVPINLSDSAVDRLAPIAWEEQQSYIAVPDAVVEALRPTLGAEERSSLSNRVTFTLRPTFADGQGLRVQDLMILRILQEAKWHRPVYFAMTVAEDAKVGLNDYLRIDGLAFKVVPYRVRHLNTDRMRDNLLTQFQYRGLNDPMVHLNVSTVKLLQNYRSAFMELARDYLSLGQAEEAMSLLDAMAERMPAEVLPYFDERHALAVSDLYRRAGYPDGLEERLQYVVPGRQLSREDRTLLAGYYAQILQKWDRAETLYLGLIDEDANDAEAYSGLFLTYKLSGQYEKGIALLEHWLIRHPNDTNAQEELEVLREIMGSGTDLRER
jgi:tetratricopeptide (TPR) repeat protein